MIDTVMSFNPVDKAVVRSLVPGDCVGKCSPRKVNIRDCLIFRELDICCDGHAVQTASLRGFWRLRGKSSADTQKAMPEGAQCGVAQ
ncbi:hypothetical protein GJAV_G00065570 [Gymnothorax javanicus]|nr:hypothetical protein GJAV_G00065570 [Gymnothorax javanicus]